MNYKKVIFPAFILLALVQIYVPASMIFSKEKILETGTAFKFKTAPIDPYDPFHGKYINLGFEAISFKIEEKEQSWFFGEEAYIWLTTDTEGFAKIQNITRTVPTDHPHYVKAEVNVYYYNPEGTTELRVTYPFDRFYMEETKALEAETTVAEINRDREDDRLTWALVKVKNGDAVLEDVLIDGVPIKEVVEQARLEK